MKTSKNILSAAMALVLLTGCSSQPAAPAQTEAVAEQSGAAPVAEQPAAPAPTAMPKDDDWDLPADLDGNNAFVPLEAGE